MIFLISCGLLNRVFTTKQKVQLRTIRSLAFTASLACNDQKAIATSMHSQHYIHGNQQVHVHSTHYRKCHTFLKTVQTPSPHINPSRCWL